MVSCAAEAGYSHVGLRLVPATPSEVNWATIGDTWVIRETLARLAATGIAVLDIEILRLKPETRVADFLPVLETAARLSARNALVAGNDPDEATTSVGVRATTIGRAAARNTLDRRTLKGQSFDYRLAPNGCSGCVVPADC